ncbi:TIGR03854 family LLM class F420-dependent oxidoreductase [Amycolatopsis roodepoortensis]|uniref:TIGR03854 family LLM class F420-dependent oxidoreductase n=1 Tax=Amycolatopsis roodepoortensis TaxID=700274 RepID=UPI00214CC4E2|nr:TIGR03854 family LLM class F420-dependent oxidoreductase [Amycolatopsis roodepoortensis]UUV33257.1 TIGR03854 family LLM class F420-dependent oxidoreductase [Amycolatopsis roodepoortensis]
MAEDLKIRIGAGLGTGTAPGEFGAAVDLLEQAGVDSLWLPEAVYSPRIDPVVGLTHALARTTKLKVGTGVMVLPGRDPVLVAKQLASLAALAPKRVLPVFGLKPARDAELPLFPVPQGRRAAVFDESLRLIRALLEQEEVTFEGEFFRVEGTGLGMPPVKRLDLWLGGKAPGALRRVGRLADGWLASFLTPEEARAGREAIQEAAAEAGREIEADHFGISLIVAEDGIPDALAASIAARSDADPSRLIAGGWRAARDLIAEHVDAGLSKFVLYPAGPEPIERFVENFVEHAVPLQN